MNKNDLKMLYVNTIHLITEHHAGQVDKGGEPYIFHLFAVEGLLLEEDFEIRIIALLHDIVEDTEVTMENLQEWGYPSRVLEAVYALTKKEGQSQEEYLANILLNFDAVKVKIADLKHNMDLTRLSSITDKDLERVKKYHNMYNILNDYYTTMKKINIL